MSLSRLRADLAYKLSYLEPRYLNARSTLRTSLGFAGTFIERYLPERFRPTTLDSIFNFLPLRPNLLTSGQPTEAQFVAVKNASVSLVINLAPHGQENSLPDENAVVTGLGMRYLHLPVDFKNPGEAEFSAVCAALQQAEAQGQKVLVHCAANMRVSALMYRYRTQLLGESRARAEQDLHRIWKPFGAWEAFIDKPLQS